MALRYLDRQEQQYVPTYTPIDPQIMSGTHRQIQAQGETFRQNKRDMLDLAAQNSVEELSTLPEEDRQYARERFERSRQNIRNIVEERGARNALPFLDEEVRGIERDLQYHRRAAAENRKLQEELADSKAGPGILSYIQRKPAEVEYDQAGDPISVKGGANQAELLTAQNWKAFDEGLSGFVSDWKANKVDQDQFRDGYVLSTSNEQVTHDEVLNASMQYLLNDDQYRNQLQLEGQKLLDQSLPKNEDGTYQDENTNMTVLQDKAGNIEGIETTVEEYERDENGNVKKDENGEPKVKGSHKVQFESLAEWQAFQQASPYAERESYRDVGLSVKGSPLEGGGGGDDTSQGNPYTTGNWGVKEPETTYDKAWKQRMGEYEKDAESRFSTQKSMLGQVASLGAGPGEYNVEVRNGEVTISRKYENDNGHITSEKITEDDIDPKFLPMFRDKKANLVQEDRRLKNEAQKFKSIRKAALQNVQRRYPSLAEYINITDQGEIEFSSTADQEKIVSDLREAGVRPIALQAGARPERGPDRDIRPGEFVTDTIEVYQEGKDRTRVEEKEVVLFNEGGTVKYMDLDDNNLISSLNRDTDKFLDRSTNNMFGTGQTKEYNIAYLNDDAKKGTLDSEINEFFDNKPITTLGGTFRDTNDPENELTPGAGAFFDPVGTFHRNGETVIAGAYYPSGKEDTDADEVRNVIYEGDISQSIGGRRNKRDVVLSRFDQQFRNSLSPITHEGQTSMSISPREQKQMGLETGGEADFNKLNIEQDSRMINRGSDSFSNINVYTLDYETRDGRSGSFSADTMEEIENQILSLIQ